MDMTQHSYKLNSDQQMHLLRLIAEERGSGEIIQEIQDTYSITITRQNILKYKRSEKWQGTLERLREVYMASVAEVAGAHKRVRMERLEELYHIAMDNEKYDLALKVIDAQRTEVEGGKADINALNLTFNQLNLLSDEELEAKRHRVLEKLGSG